MVDVPESSDTPWGQWLLNNSHCLATFKDNHLSAQFVRDWLHDHDHVEQALQVIAEVANDQQGIRLTIDVGMVDNLSSSVIAHLLRMAKSVNANRGKMQIVNCRPHVADTLNVVHLHELCEISLKN